MKKALTAVLIVVACQVNAQTWNEWTKQKKTQIKYLVNQIAALQFYIGYAEKGYAIAKTGLNAIHSIKKGDFSLHSEYFNSLKIVNPKVKSYWKVADIISLQIKIVQSYHKQKNVLRQSGQFTPGEVSYYSTVFTNLLDGCTNIIGQLLLIATNGNSEMKDDERMKKIDAMYENMKDKFLFVEHFNREANELRINRIIDANDVRTSRSLLNLNQ